MELLSNSQLKIWRSREVDDDDDDAPDACESSILDLRAVNYVRHVVRKKPIE